MDLLKLKFLRALSPYVMLLLRIAFGLIVMNHGWAKYSGGAAGVSGFFGGLGIPVPTAAAWLVIVVELIGGLCIVLGVLPRLWSLLFAIVMVVAIVLAKIPGGEGFGSFELEFLLLFVAIYVAVKGGGSPAVGPMIGLADDD